MSLLDEAIIDATALKEAALKNAEALVLEKYSLEIKEALRSLMEQDDPMDVMPMPLDPAAAPDDISKDISFAHADGEKLCACPEDEETIELDLNKLADEISSEAEMTGGPGDRVTMKREDKLFPELQKAMQEGNAYTIDKKELLDIYETLNVDAREVAYGNTEYPANNLEVEHAKDVAKAKKVALELEDENEEIKKENKSLKGRIISYQKKLEGIATITEALANKAEKYESVLVTLQEKLESVTTSNARLLYTNRVLNNNSLNERQKQKLVESLSNAKTANEAKVIFETLQSTMSSEKVSTPKSLSEAIDRTSTSLFRSRQQEVSTPQLDRLQRLAGIKNKN